nr:uncharacterized protein LOC111512748 isoform X1 [Leptinotarsa decemlineata]
MESITSEQLSQYEKIMEQISNELKKSDELRKQLEKENDRIILYNLIKQRVSQKLSSTSLKIFHNIVHLLSLYEDEIQMDIGDLLTCQNCKYYLIEVYIAKALFQKLKDMNCIISISLKIGDKCINKSVNIPKTLPLVEIIIVDDNVVESILETCIIFPDERWMTIKLETINVDISYHFQKPNKTSLNTKINKILQLSKRYNELLDFKCFKDEMQLEYEFRCKIDPSEFLEAILKNSYHNLSIDHFTGLNTDDSNDFLIELSHGSGRHEFRYDKNNKLQVKSNLQDLQKLKVHIYTVFHKEAVMHWKLAELTELKEKIPLIIGEVRSFYTNMRKCWWSNLPV